MQDAPAAQAADSKPDELPLDVSPAGQKRKASPSGPDGDDDSSNSPKRIRRDSETAGNGSVRSPPAPAPLDRRQNASVEEKKRGKRLFGGLLSTLSQTNNSSSQKRRTEIERRQQARVSQQKAEDDKHREARLAKLKAARRQEQIEWEEQVVCGPSL